MNPILNLQNQNIDDSNSGNMVLRKAGSHKSVHCSSHFSFFAC